MKLLLEMLPRDRKQTMEIETIYAHHHAEEKNPKKQLQRHRKWVLISVKYTFCVNESQTFYF